MVSTRRATKKSLFNVAWVSYRPPKSPWPEGGHAYGETDHEAEKKKRESLLEVERVRKRLEHERRKKWRMKPVKMCYSISNVRNEKWGKHS